MPRLQALLFDLDGTLVDSAPDLRQALNATLAANRRRALTLDEVKGMTGDGLLPLMQRAFAATGEPISESTAYARFQDFVARYRAIGPDPGQLYPGAREIIAQMKTAEIKLGLCTNKQEAATLKLLEGLGILNDFGFVAGGDTFTVHKPDPGHVQGVLEKLGVASAHAAMIGTGLTM